MQSGMVTREPSPRPRVIMAASTQAGLVHCFDLALPERTRFAAWSDEGEVRVVMAANGRRVMVFASPGALVFALGMPVPLPDDPQALQDWYAAHPVTRPIWFRADVYGKAERMPGDLPIPTSALQDPALRELRALWRKSMNNVASSGVPTEQTQTDRPSQEIAYASAAEPTDLPKDGARTTGALVAFSVELVEGTRALVTRVSSGDVRMEESETNQVRVLAEAGASFVFSQVPADSEVSLDWFLENPSARATGYRATDDGQIVVDPWALELLAARIQENPDSEEARTWSSILAHSETARTAGLRSVAVSSTDVSRFVAEQRRAPRALVGKTGILYAPLSMPMSNDQVPQVFGVVPAGAPTHAIRVDMEAEDGRYTVLYAPVGGRYGLRSSSNESVNGESGERKEVVLLRKGGERLPLPESEQARFWSEANALDIVQITPKHRRAGRTSTAEAPESVASAVAPPPITDEPPGDLWSDDAPLPEPTLEDLGAMEGSGVLYTSKVQPHGTSDVPTLVDSDSADVSSSVRWRSPFEGPVNVRNWQKRSPVGELWIAELLYTAVDHPEELDALGCLVPISLLRQGYQISRSDRERIQRALDGHLADRLSYVRVYDLEGHTYFARETDQGIHLVGPRCSPVRSVTIRSQVAKSYGLTSDEVNFVDPKPVEPEATLKRSRPRSYDRPTSHARRL